MHRRMLVGKSIDGPVKPDPPLYFGWILSFESTLDEVAEKSADDEIGIGMRDFEVGEVIQVGVTAEGRDIPD